MRKKICVTAVCIVMLSAMIPGVVFAADNDWIYDNSGKTLTNSAGTITINNVRSSNSNLAIEYNQEKDFTTIDLTGTIKDKGGKEYTLQEIGVSAFSRCQSLESVKLPDSVTYIGSSAFSYCSSLKFINIPDGVESIESQTFLECGSLISVDIPDSVKEIGDTAFANCKALASIDLPAGIEKIGAGAFGGCSNLRTVTVDTMYPPTLGENVFASLPGDFSIIVPRESYNRYVNFPDWKKYAHRIKAGSLGIGTTNHDYEDGRCTICGAHDPEFVCEIKEGAYSIWKKGSKEGLSFVSNAAYADFMKVQIDGRDLGGENYNVDEGSTIVTLKAEYLETIPVGRHSISVVFHTGTAETEFTIEAVSDGTVKTGDGGNVNVVSDTGTAETEFAIEAVSDGTVKTGDGRNIDVWMVIAGVSAVGAMSSVLFRKRKKM